MVPEVPDGPFTAVIFVSFGNHLVGNLADDRSVPVGDDVLDVILGSFLQADVVWGQQRAGFGGIDLNGLR